MKTVQVKLSADLDGSGGQGAVDAGAGADLVRGLTLADDLAGGRHCRRLSLLVFPGASGWCISGGAKRDA